MTYKLVTLAEDLTDSSTWETFEVEDLIEFLESRYEVFPPTAKIYHGEANAQREVTPNSEATIELLQTLPGPFYVIVYPEYDAGIGEYALIVALIALVVAVALSAAPHSPITSNQQTPSPNNELSARQNSARPFQRIPDIYGTVRSTPDLLMLPYSEYINNIEYEHAYMCIGRGEFVVFDACDDKTPIHTIDGAGVTVFKPFDSPNIGGPGIFDRTVFGANNAVPVLNVSRCTAVNGQDLLTDSESVDIGTKDTMAFTMDLSTGRGTIVFSGGENLSAFSAGQSVYLFFTGYKTHHTTHDINLSGTYVIYSVNSTTLVLKDVQSVANDWGWLAWTGEYGIYVSHVVAPLALAIGPFFLPQADQNQIWLNLVALNGMYKLDSGGVSTAVDANIRAIIQPTDTLGNPTGSSYSVDFAFNGDSTKITVAYTWKINLATVGPCTITVYRTSLSPISSQVVDGIKWKDLLSIAEVGVLNFGNVTTVYSVTKATAGALAVKQRKLNLLVQRKVPARIGTTSTFGDIAGSNSIADIVCAAALDPYIGMRNVSEIDVTNIYNTAADIATYFGNSMAQEFCYTFDTNNLSFEEIIQSMSSAVFSIAYRQGSLMRLAFEKKTENSLMLFGHRNKVPKSERRSVAFGPINDFDSIEYSFVSPVDESQVTIYVPSQGVNPSKITGTGVRNGFQAYWQAWRAWNKLAYQNVVTEFEGMQEAALLKLNDRILVADNTRSGTQDGDVILQNVLELELSQPVTFAPGKSYVIFLQGVDESVDNIPINPGSTAYHVLLTRAPAVTLSLGGNASVRALYWIVANDDIRPQAFLVSKRETGSTNFTQKITAINYDDRYYTNDAITPVTADVPAPVPTPPPVPPTPPVHVDSMKILSTEASMTYWAPMALLYPSIVGLGGTWNPATAGANVTLSDSDTLATFSGQGSVLTVNTSGAAGTWKAYEIVITDSTSNKDLFGYFVPGHATYDAEAAHGGPQDSGPSTFDGLGPIWFDEAGVTYGTYGDTSSYSDPAGTTPIDPPYTGLPALVGGELPVGTILGFVVSGDDKTVYMFVNGVSYTSFSWASVVAGYGMGSRSA